MKQLQQPPINSVSVASQTGTKFRGFLGMLLAAMAGGTDVAAAAPLHIGQDQVPFQELGLTPDVEIGGRSVQASATVAQEVRYYFTPGLNVMSPTVITVLVGDPDRPAKVTMHRHFWNEADLKAETDASGTWSFTGRIDDSIGIMLSAEDRQTAETHICIALMNRFSALGTAEITCVK